MIDKKILQQNIITALNLKSLPDERKARLLTKMAELAEKRLLLRVLEEMKDEDADYFAKNVADKDEEAKAKFLQEKFPNFIEMMQEELVKAKNEVMAAGKIE